MPAAAAAPRARHATAAHACLLAFDTRTETLAVALRRARATCWTHDGARRRAGIGRADPGDPRAAGAAPGWRLRDLDAIAFGRGPGAFTGLRTACAVAQGLAFGAGVPVLAIDSLLVVAEDARAQAPASTRDVDVCVAMDARMDEIYAGRYRWAAGRWQVLRRAGAVHAGRRWTRAWRRRRPPRRGRHRARGFRRPAALPPRRARCRRGAATAPRRCCALAPRAAGAGAAVDAAAGAAALPARQGGADHRRARRSAGGARRAGARHERAGCAAGRGA